MNNTAGDIELTIVMPCLDEAETLETCIKKASTFLERSGVKGEIVIGDNGSTDGSREIAARAGAMVVDVPVRGYGAALYGAIQAARGKFIIMGDADDSYDFLGLEVFLEKLREGYDLVMGNRFRGGIKPGAMPWKNRYIGNPILSFTGRMLFKSRVGDFHCGLRAFSRDAFNRMDLKTSGMEFATEMIVKSVILGMRICEVPTTLSPDGRSRTPHLRPLRDGWRHLRFMLLFSPDWLFLYPGIALMLLGAAGIALLLPAPLPIGPFTLDVHTMLYMAMMLIIGFQLVMFAGFTKVFLTTQKMVPEKKALPARLFSFINLETGILIGLILLATGGYKSVQAFMAWQSTGFQGLDPADTLRIVIPALVYVLLGCQVIVSSIFFSVLGLSVREK